jgi:hypothetical protein
MSHPVRRLSAPLVLTAALFASACSGSLDAASATSPLPGGSGSSEPGSGSPSSSCDAGAATPIPSGPSPSPVGSDASAPVAPVGPLAPSPPSSGTIGFHLLLGVSGSDSPGDSLTLDGDEYTDLVMSNFVAGAMYGHLVRAYTPTMQIDRDYLYGSIFAQLLQENLATEDYATGTGLIDSSPDQQAVMGSGQGGPYQINNYAADMVYGSYEPKGYSLVNYVALQKNIGFAFADAATQYTKATPAAFNDLYFGPMLTAYFHFNDYVALQEIGPMGGYTPGWEPDYDHALAAFESLPGNFLDVLLNVAYNQGYYGTLVASYSHLGATATASTVSTVDGYASVWGVSDTYRQYPYQVRYYLDQLYDAPVPTTSPTTTTTPQNHVRFGMAQLGATFAAAFAKLAYVDAKAGYGTIPGAQASAAFAASLAKAGVDGSAALDLSDAAGRAAIFDVLDGAIAGLESSLGTSFIARSTTAL